MPVSFEEWKFLKKSFPGNRFIFSAFHQMLGDLHGLFEFCDDYVPSGDGNFFCRVHLGLCWRDDGKVVFFSFFVKQVVFEIFLNRNFTLVCGDDTAQVDRIVCAPFS